MVEASGELQEGDEPQESGRLITAIGIFKATSGVIFLAGALGTFSLLGKDLDDVADVVVSLLKLSPESKLVHFLYDKADSLTDGSIKLIGSVQLVYGALLLAEGYGLLRRRRWAELLVVIATCIPVPFELYELVEKPKILKVLVLIVNLAIAWYVWHRRQQFTTRKQRKAAREAAGAVATVP